MDHSSGEPPAGGQGVRLVHDPDRERYEALDGTDVVAVLCYADQPADPSQSTEHAVTVRDLRSTVVAPERSGEGIGAALVRHALDEARTKGLRARATCWFVAGWIQRHPEYAELLAPESKKE